MDKVKIIRALIDSGRVKDVLDFVEGESEYVSDKSEGAPQARELRRLWILVVHHLRFLSEFGSTPAATKDGKYLISYPREFDLWLDAGAPGVAEQDIMEYLKKNPL
ncbi:hypothetical protein [Stutzerimonas kirkiae]|uniref:hypothetical protein n=1 Tax=Stutzerimonas kirkiae TaxID=2211392 RepID=UPI0010383E5B|nr:hypothetical protein [Stutzerimonas kirkiae]